MASLRRARRVSRLLVLVALLVPLAGMPGGPSTALANSSFISVQSNTPAPTSVAVVGNLQSELGCPGDWDPSCAATRLTHDAGDDVWQGSWNVPAGTWDYKAALNGSWDENYGANAQPNGNNIPLSLASPTSVKFYYDHKSHWITSNQNAAIATAAGSFQSELGCRTTGGAESDWDPGCLRSWLQDPDGDGTYSFSTTAIPAGSYEAKVTINESWDENYGAGGTPGGANIAFSVAATGNKVVFSYNATTHVLSITTGAAQDNNVFWDQLGHNSRDTLYRTPGGAVSTGTPVTLRLRAASNDLTAAKVRIWNDRTDTQSLLSMTRVAGDGEYEWWEATIPASAEPTIYWYRFIAIDGADTDYYEDDSGRTGGWGETLDESADRSWQLTVYDPSFETPDWVKDAVIYQVFPDRFRDGEPANNPAAGTFFYNEADGTIVRSNGTDWNTVVCDPRATGSCAGTYSKNFYGGDLQGITAKIHDNYFNDLGVTALYLNPIFESPSNHKYDTTDFSKVDDSFGGDAAFAELVAAADEKGLRVVLDGVFNHTSSDSIYFDRYGRYPEVGACESATSPYRDWYYFSDVAAGAGPCVGSNGVAGGATYESWFSYDSLPKLNAANDEVRALIWSNGSSSIAPMWINEGADGWRLDVGGDVDPGVTNNAANDYWEGFRTAVRGASADAYIVGEEWGMATPWTLGQEWDATMNYQFGSAIMSFWRDTAFEDNDHNTGSSAGVLTPLTPSQLDERLHNLEERYPPEALQAMMNLLGSHDTSRALFMLDERTDERNASLYENPDYDWSDAMTRLKGVWLLQMTLPGAPTTYYGDEVGLVGPAAVAGDRWEDDPYNRQPFPWIGEEYGTPFYTHLQSQTGQDQLRGYYKLLTAGRKAHPALRTGSFDTLLTDDANKVYAYGRKMTDNSDAAIVINNRADSAQSVTVDVGGYLPAGTQLTNVLAGNAPVTVAGDGTVTVNVPARGGALLVLNGPIAAPPAAPANLQATAGNGNVSLEWSAVVRAASYNIYRSILSGGGYALVGNTAATTFDDTTVENGTRYYYVVRAVGSGGTSGASGEAAATPAYQIGWAILQHPKTIEHTLGVAPTETIYGRVWIQGLTDSDGDAGTVHAEVGFGQPGSTADDWTTWKAMTFNKRVDNNYEYQGNLRPEEVGTFDYLVRFSTDRGLSWTYGDQNGVGTATPGVLTVVLAADTTPPAAPTNLRVTDWSPSSIDLAWDSVSDAAEYWLYRDADGALSSDAERIAKLDASTTSYSDLEVANGTLYTYAVKAVDQALNRSAVSNEVSQRAETQMVDVTFRVAVPDETPLADTTYVVGDIAALGPWNPGKQAMANVGGGIWETTIEIADGTPLQYKYTRGMWDKVENWGTISGFGNRSTTISYGPGGTQLIDNTATDWGTGADWGKAVQFWRDALVESVSRGLLRGNTLTATYATPVLPTGALGDVIVVKGPDGQTVAGTVTADSDRSFVFSITPGTTLKVGRYTATAFNVRRSDVGDGVSQQSPYSWNFAVNKRK